MLLQNLSTIASRKAITQYKSNMCIWENKLKLIHTQKPRAKFMQPQVRQWTVFFLDDVANFDEWLMIRIQQLLVLLRRVIEVVLQWNPNNNRPYEAVCSIYPNSKSQKIIFKKIFSINQKNHWQCISDIRLLSFVCFHNYFTTAESNNR